MMISELIAQKFVEGLYHPGDGEHQAPLTIRLPMFRTSGMPEPMVQQVTLTTKLISEAIVYLIEHEGNSDIVPKQQETK